VGEGGNGTAVYRYKQTIIAWRQTPVALRTVASVHP